jgi:hypothetical protein
MTKDGESVFVDASASGIVLRTEPTFRDVLLAITDNAAHQVMMVGAHMMLDGSVYFMQSEAESGTTVQAFFLSAVDVANFHRLYDEYQALRAASRPVGPPAGYPYWP